MIAALAAIGLIVVSSGCAAQTIWLGGHPPIVEHYTAAQVRIYRVGQSCRIEVITLTDTILTLPTRCVTAPHVARP